MVCVILPCHIVIMWLFCNVYILMPNALFTGHITAREEAKAKIRKASNRGEPVDVVVTT
jgi:hypothetical protein